MGSRSRGLFLFRVAGAMVKRWPSGTQQRERRGRMAVQVNMHFAGV